MRRVQIFIEDWQLATLKTLAKREGRSVSALVREMVALPALAGLGEDREATGRDHDRFIYGVNHD